MKHYLLLQEAVEAKTVHIEIQILQDIMDKQHRINLQIIIQHIQLQLKLELQVQQQVVQWEFHNL